MKRTGMEPFLEFVTTIRYLFVALRGARKDYAEYMQNISAHPNVRALLNSTTEVHP